VHLIEFQFGINHPSQLDKFLRVSNKVVMKLTKSLSTFHRSIHLNEWINRQLKLPLPWNGSHIKALGAGGELGATLIPSGEPLIISLKGVQCQL